MTGVWSKRAARLGPRPRTDRRGRNARAGAPQLARPRAACGEARLQPLLGRRAPQPERDRERCDLGGHRPHRPGDGEDPHRGRWGDAAESSAARDRRAVRDAGGALPRQGRSRCGARAGDRPGHAAGAPPGSVRGLVPAGRSRAAGAARRSAARPTGACDPGRGIARPALDPRLEPLRRAARSGPRAPVRVRLALRTRRAPSRARDLPGALPTLRSAATAVRDGRRQRRRRGRRRNGRPSLHLGAAVVHEHLPRRSRTTAATRRRHRGVLVERGEGPRVATC